MLELNQSAISFLKTAAAICEEYGKVMGDTPARKLDDDYLLPAARDLTINDLHDELGAMSAQDLTDKVAWALRDIASAAESGNRYRG